MPYAPTKPRNYSSRDGIKEALDDVLVAYPEVKDKFAALVEWVSLPSKKAAKVSAEKKHSLRASINELRYYIKKIEYEERKEQSVKRYAGLPPAAQKQLHIIIAGLKKRVAQLEEIINE